MPNKIKSLILKVVTSSLTATSAVKKSEPNEFVSPSAIDSASSAPPSKNPETRADDEVLKLRALVALLSQLPITIDPERGPMYHGPIVSIDFSKDSPEAMAQKLQVALNLSIKRKA